MRINFRNISGVSVNFIFFILSPKKTNYANILIKLAFSMTPMHLNDNEIG